MPKFTVSVCRIGYSIKEIEVEADTQEEANSKALDHAPNEVFDSEHASDYRLEDDVKDSNRVLIHLSGGVVQDIFADRPGEIDVILRDFDIEGSEHEIAADGELYTDDNGSTYQEVYRGVTSWDHLETQPFANPVKPEDLK